MEAYKIKVAAVGASLTHGSGASDWRTKSYPAQLQAMLGNDYEVANFGVSGRTMLRSGERPYWVEDAYK